MNGSGSLSRSRSGAHDLKVLHVLATYLNVTENWIFPQIVGVPDVDTCVTCNSLANVDTFAIDRRRIIISPPPWNFAFGFPRMINSLAARLGRRDALAE